MSAESDVEATMPTIFIVGAADIDRAADREVVRRGVRRVEHGDIRARVVRASSARPSTTVTAESGPTAVFDASMPSTVNESTSNDPPPKPPPLPALRGLRACGGCLLRSIRRAAGGARPMKVMFVRLSAPDAAATPSTPVTRLDGRRVERSAPEVRHEPRLAEVGRAVIRRRAAVLAELELRPARPPLPGCAWAPVTVRSVPTP